jgi:Uma2 family endonuclease
VRQRRWTKAEYYRLGELGFFRGQRVELIEGRLMVQSPQNSPHATALLQVAGLLQGLVGPGHHVRPQFPLDLGPSSEPEPDIAVVAGNVQQFRNAHPTSAVLLVEVSDSRVSYDRRRKGSLYARAGIADYWIVNLVRRRLEVYRDPVADATHPYGHRYSTRTDLTPPATVSPLAFPQLTLAVADLLP